MTLSDRLHSFGFESELSISGEIAIIQGNPVVVCVNTNPYYLEMLESGYMKKEPVVLEVMKGSDTSTKVSFIEGNATPSDLRGFCPTVLRQLTYSGRTRKMMTIHDASDRWIITTIIDNVKNPLVP